jgi:hypothetical protein
MELQKVINRALQVNTIVQAGTQHDLAVQDDSCIRQPVNLFHQPIVFRIPEKAYSQFRLRRVNGNVKGREPLIDNPLHLGFIDVGQSQIIPEQERKPVILILYMKGLPHALRILVHEAKHALVFADQRLDRLEFEAEGLPLASQKSDRAVLGTDSAPAADGSRSELKVDDIEQRPAIQFMNLITRPQPYALRQRSGFYG